MKNSASQKLAGRYVKALFDVAGSAKAIDVVEKDLIAIAALAESNSEVAGFLGNPLLTRKQSAAGMDALLEKIGAHKVTRQFIAMLAAQKRLPALPAIAELFAETAAKSRGELSALVTSAAPMKDSEIAALAEKLGKIYGKKIALKSRVNPELIGGVIVKIGSTQFDGSVAGKLARLKNTLKAA